MRLNLDRTERLTREAVVHYWTTLAVQGAKQQSGDPDRGGRAAVTGGKQMDGFGTLVRDVLLSVGLADEHILNRRNLEIPGYFRPTKRWDLLVVHEKNLLAAMEFKSQRGPSFGNNFNNRSEEAIGTGQDFVTAFREGAFGDVAARPWTGWLMLLQDCEESRSAVEVAEPHHPVFPEFRGASYTARYALLLRKLVREGLYNSAALITASEQTGPSGTFREPARDLVMRRFLAGLAGHVAAYLASR